MIGIERISDDTRLFDLTTGELKELIRSAIPEPKKQEDKKLVYGINGIAELFGCSKAAACRLKSSGLIDKAISQYGRTIVVDVEKALELTRIRK
ncbi:MAG: DUF3853 family protein [Bacteroides nordii]